ncbi:MAG: helix-turn-helix domain-containing protein [Oscillospiraceae bacterium]|jgi:excisionase family DNA binding protein|nr:helix-turn-helix domain-containing protein [Oscillospiraceae bacterium]
MSDDILTITQTAEYLRVSDKTVRRLIKDEKLTASKVGERVWRVRESDILKYLNTNTNRKEQD